MGKLPVKDHYRSINKSLQNGERSIFDSAEGAPIDLSLAEAQASPEQQLSQYQQARMTKQAITKMNKSSNINIENGGREFLNFAGAKSHVQDTYQHHKLAQRNTQSQLQTAHNTKLDEGPDAATDFGFKQDTKHQRASGTATAMHKQASMESYATLQRMSSLERYQHLQRQAS